MKTRYRNRLPHIQPVGAGFFVTFRIFNSLSKEILSNIQLNIDEQRKDLQSISDPGFKREMELKLWEKYLWLMEAELDKLNSPNNWLKHDAIAQIIKEELFRWDGKYYDLLCFSIMSNHVHLVIDTSVQLINKEVCLDIENNYVQLDQILKRIKGATAFRCNPVLKKSGQFWERESWDVYIRNQKMLQNVITYTLENPVKAGLVRNWQDYKWNYWKGA